MARTSIVNALRSLNNLSTIIVSKITDIQSVVTSKTTEISDSVDAFDNRLRDRLDRSQSYLREHIGNISQETRSEFDKILEMIRNGTLEGHEAIAGVLEQVRTGDVTLQDFLARFGDIQAEIGIAGKSLREMFQSMDLAGLQDEIRNFRKGMREEITGIEDVYRRLSEVNSEAARQLIMILDLWQKGKFTLEEVISKIKLLEEAVPEGTTTDQLLDDVSDYLVKSQRSGG